MQILSVEQYKEVICGDVLLPRQVEALELLYQFPNSCATASQLAKVVDPNRHSASITSFRIGRTGKRIADYFQIEPQTYLHNGKVRPAYSTFISEPYDSNGLGGNMHVNLRKALKELLVARESDKGYLYEKLSTEVPSANETQLFKEGKVIKTFVNKYERSLLKNDSSVVVL